MSCHLLLNLFHELANMILCEALPSIISFLPTNLRFYLLHNCENYRNIDFSVINKDRRNWVKVVIRSNRKTQRRQNIVPNKRNIIFNNMQQSTS